MSATTTTGLVYATGGDPAAIHTITANLAATANSKVVGSFADTNARDVAYSAEILAGKTGMRCWIVNRSGYSYYTGATYGWRWEPQKNTLFENTRPSAAGTSGASPVAIIQAGALNLPPGNRRIEVSWSSWCINTTIGGVAILPRTYITNIASAEGWSQNYCAGNNSVTCNGTANTVAAGTVSYDLWGLDAGGGGTLTFNSSKLLIVDIGPE